MTVGGSCLWMSCLWYELPVIIKELLELSQNKKFIYLAYIRVERHSYILPILVWLLKTNRVVS